jgi:AAA family ATP:ADP antiporter
MLVMAGHAMLETARDALFLERVAATRLPWVYLALAAAGFVAARYYRDWRSRREPVSFLSLTLFGIGAVTLGMWWLFAWPWPAMRYVFYVWTGVAAAFVVVQLWALLGNLHTVTQAKRLYGWIGMGSVTGAILGSALARALTEQLHPRHLVIGGALLFWLAAVACRLTFVRYEFGATDDESHSVVAGMRAVLRERYLRRLGSLSVVATVVVVAVDFVFKSTVAAHVPGPELGTFFATFNLALNAGALLAQLAVASWLVRRLGVDRAAWLLPLVLLVAAGGLWLGAGLAAAMTLKAAEGTLRHSVHRTALEILFVPVADDVRSGAKYAVDLVGQRGGQALGALLIAVVGALAVDGVRWVAGGILGGALLWIVLALDLRREYLAIFRNNLTAVTLRARATLPPLDRAAYAIVLQALNSTTDDQVLAALDLLAEQRQTQLIPLLILYHPSARVVLRALELFASARRSDFLPIAERLGDHREVEIRAAALRARLEVAPDDGLAECALHDASPLVRATALATMMQRRPRDAGLAGQLRSTAADPEVPTRMALARSIEQQPHPVFASVLHQLGSDADLGVRERAICAMQALGDPQFIAPLMGYLAEPRLRPAARRALATYGDAALTALERAFDDTNCPGAVRRHLPGTMAVFGAAAAVPLLERLGRERDGAVRYQVLRALGRLRAAVPWVPLLRAPLDKALETNLRSAIQLCSWQSTLEHGAEPLAAGLPAHDLLVALLADKRREALERIFRLLHLMEPQADFMRVLGGLASSDATVRSSSIELIEAWAPIDVREAVIALVTDDCPPEERLERAARYFDPRVESYVQVLEQMLALGGESLRSLAAYQAGELLLTELREQLVAARHLGRDLVIDAVDHALMRLDQAAPAAE